MNTIELEFNEPNSLDDYDTFIGVHSPFYLEKDKPIKECLTRYVREGMSLRKMAVVGYNSGDTENFLDAERFKPVKAETFEGKDEAIAGIPPTYLNDINHIDRYLDGRNVDKAVKFVTEPENVEEYGSVQRAFVEAQRSLENNWITLEWSESTENGANSWKYRKGLASTESVVESEEIKDYSFEELAPLIADKVPLENEHYSDIHDAAVVVNGVETDERMTRLLEEEFEEYVPRVPLVDSL